MTFKESIKDDLDSVLFDVEEFADEHLIDGERVISIIQDFTFNSARTIGQQRNMVNMKETSVNKSSFIIYIKEDDVKNMKRKRITANSVINVDGKNHFVQECKTSGGVTKVITILQQN